MLLLDKMDEVEVDNDLHKRQEGLNYPSDRG